MNEIPQPDPALFLSGDNGLVVGPRLTVKRTAADLAYGAMRAARLVGPRLDRLAAAQRPLRVLVVSVYRPGSRLPAALPRMRAERHDVVFAFGSTREPDPALAELTVAAHMTGGKFENVNALLEKAPALTDFDRLIVVDDDIDLPIRFLDRFVAVCERLALDLAQPAQSMRSHAAWRVTRTRPSSLARLTNFVEIGPLTMFSRRATDALAPFPPLRFGWGLDNHWGAIARDRGWRLGVIDALPVRHEWQRIASSYTHAEATAEASRFLAGRDFVRTDDAQRTVATIRRLGP
ncbi:MAG: hypothetical protein ACR2J6_05010 [Thermoleophilaceae bacterium]